MKQPMQTVHGMSHRHRLWQHLKTASCVLVLGWVAGFSQQVTADDQSVVSIQQLASDPIQQSGAEFRLEHLRRASGQSTWLQLTPTSIFAPDAKIVVNPGAPSEEVLPPIDIRHYTGTEQGSKSTQAFVSVHPDGSVHGWLLSGGKTESFTLGAGSTEAARISEVVMQTPETADREFQCGNDDLHQPESTLSEPSEMALAAAALDLDAAASNTTPPARYIARVAIETDQEFYQRFGSNGAAQAYIADLFGLLSSRYNYEVQTGFQISRVNLWNGSVTDPWNQTGTNCQLYQMGKYWNDNLADHQRTFVHMLSGRALGGGVAWTGSLCGSAFNTNAPAGCTFSGEANYGGDYGLSAEIVGTIGAPSQMYWDYYVVAHEIGHQFNSPHTHCYGGIQYAEPIDKCYNQQTATGCWRGSVSLPGAQGTGSGTLMSYCHQRAGNITNISNTFGTDHTRGHGPLRVPRRMRAHVVERAEQYPSCLIPAAADTVSLNVALQGTGQVTSQPASLACKSDSCQGAFARNSSVTLKAIAGVGNRFDSWSGACSGTSLTCQVTMSQARQVTAKFQAAETRSLRVNRTGSGTVASAPTGLDCPSNNSPCHGDFTKDSTVTLTAQPATGMRFSRWEGDCSANTQATCSLNMSQARTASVVFVTDTTANRRLTVTRTGTGSVISTPAGINCGPTCAADFREGSQVTLQATPGIGQRFGTWGGGVCSGSAASCTVTMSQARTVTASFVSSGGANNQTLNVTVNGSGSVRSSPAGINCNASSCTGSFTRGATVTLTAQPASGWRVRQWGGGCALAGNGTTCEIGMVGTASARNASITFERVAAVTQTLTVTRTGSGAVTSSPAGLTCSTSNATCQGAFTQGSTVTLTAQPASGWQVRRWGGGCDGSTGATCQIAMPINRNASVTFEQISGGGGDAGGPFVLTVNRTGNGSVASTAAGINCGSTCQATLEGGRQVTLLAIAQAGNRFAGWTGACQGSRSSCTVTMNGARSVTARFVLSSANLTVSTDGNGTVTGFPADIDCGSRCQATVPLGHSVTLTPQAASGHKFVGWSGACSGSTARCSVTMDAARSVTARFVPVAASNLQTITVVVGGVNAASIRLSGRLNTTCDSRCEYSIDPNATLRPGQSRTLQLEVNSIRGGLRFVGWTGACSGTSYTCTPRMGTSETATAMIMPNPATVRIANNGWGRVTSQPAGIDCGNGGTQCEASFLFGQRVTLTTTPAAGWQLRGWSGCASESNGACVISASTPQANSSSATPTYIQIRHPLSVRVVAGSNSGVVSSSPSGISCGSTCQAHFNEGSSVTLTAGPRQGQRFGGWGGACASSGLASTCVVAISGAHDVTARFESGNAAPQNTVNVTLNGNGTVTSSPAGVTCSGNTCRGTFARGTPVTLTASPAAGARFHGWGGACGSSQGLTCQLELSQDRSSNLFFATYSPESLQSGVPVSGLAAPQGNMRFYVIDVPANARKLRLNLSGGTGDADMYVRRVGPPTRADYDCRPYTGSNSEECSTDNPQAGRWHIMVHAYRDYTGATLRATIER